MNTSNVASSNFAFCFATIGRLNRQSINTNFIAHFVIVSSIQFDEKSWHSMVWNIRENIILNEELVQKRTEYYLIAFEFQNQGLVLALEDMVAQHS